ncbi:DUF4160 domain-containing protein [Pseudanabaena sp. FACHB-1277]|uniref:DUF4160 domain-containing protein n=1 Tax=Pseudanabaena cinerea FACHB-1277 TaxID=2949581 RepID=A0A926UT90_9CYAN|nr:DUF4160 domain-containing protein [Pseudanabaena cinerea FACHB-1277]
MDFHNFFASLEQGEPPHIHVQHDGNVAKFWLQPIKLQNTGGFSATELNQIAKTVKENQVDFLEKWHDFFGG